jgi:gamma-glutamyltranspeptidase / glutathione hydrolase
MERSDDRYLDRRDRRGEARAWSAASDRGVVVSAHYRATEAGARTLAAGGNAIDAAVATSLALGVVEPAGSGLGGMGMMMVHLASTGRTFIIEGACRAPSGATPEEVAPHPRKAGFKAVAVPMLPSVLGHALMRYGSMSLSEVLSPAIELATEGHLITAFEHEHTLGHMRGLGHAATAEVFLPHAGRPLPIGARHHQPALAWTLKRLATEGFGDFYHGEIARRIARDMEAHGGFVCLEDLSLVDEPTERVPMSGFFGDMQIMAVPPPGGGASLVEALHLHDRLSARYADPDHPDGILRLAAIIRRTRLDRRRFRHTLGSDGLLPELASVVYADRTAVELAVALANPGAHGETSHVSILDQEGNAVALTQSIERSFGAKVLTPDLGFLYNGYMKGFKIEDERHPHYLRSGAVARSNAAPTLLLKNGRPVIAIGSTGSERMISGIFMVLARLERQTPFEAVAAPRMHVSPEGDLFLEAGRATPAVLSAITRAGYRLIEWEPWAFQAGGLHLAVRDGERFVGVADPRRDGAAAGPEGLPSIDPR